MKIQNLIAGLFASFVTVSAKAPKARKQKPMAIATEYLEDRALMSGVMAADYALAGNAVARTARKAPTVTGNLDGVQARIMAVGDGIVLAGETDTVARLTLSASRSKYFFSGLQQELLGGGSQIAGMGILHGSNILDAINPNGNGSSAYTGYSFGPINKKGGQYSFDINLTAKSDTAEAVDVTLKFPQLSLRRGRRLIQLTGLLGNQTAITVKAGGNGTNPDGGGTPGFTVVPSGGSFDPQEGSSDTGTIVLNKQPAGSVTIMATSTNPDIQLGQTSWTFTPSNWNIPQNITVMGLEDVDTIDDTGEIRFSIVDASSSNEYDNVLDQVFIGLVHDNDTTPVVNPQIVITQTGGNTTMNEGGTDTFMVGLDRDPMGTYVVNLSVSDATALGLSTTSITFTSANYTGTTVTATGLADADTNNESVTITATGSTDMESIVATVIDTTVINNPTEVNWDAVQFYTTRAIKIISISGFDPVYAYETMTLRIDINRNGDANEDSAEVMGWTTADANGGFIVQANGGGVDMPADSHGLVTFYDPASQGFRNASGITIVYVDATGVHNVNSSSPNVSLNGNTLVIS